MATSSLIPNPRILRGEYEGKKFQPKALGCSKYRVDCYINGCYTKAVLDTGSPFNVISLDFALQCELHDALDFSTLDKTSGEYDVITREYKSLKEDDGKDRRLGMQKFKFAVFNHIFRDWFHCYTSCSDIPLCLGMSFFMYAECTFFFRQNLLGIGPTKAYLPLVDNYSNYSIGSSDQHLELVDTDPTEWSEGALVESEFLQEEGDIFKHEETGVFAVDLTREQEKILIAKPYVNCSVNGVEVNDVLVDTGCTHGYITEACAERVDVLKDVDPSKSCTIATWNPDKPIHSLGDIDACRIQMGDITLEVPLTCIPGEKPHGLHLGNGILAGFNAIFNVPGNSLTFHIAADEFEEEEDEFEVDENDNRDQFCEGPAIIPRSPAELFPGLDEDAYPFVTPTDKTSERKRVREQKRRRTSD